MEFSYEHFIHCLSLGDHREFWYKDLILVITSEIGKATLYIEEKGIVIEEQRYGSPQELLDTVKIDGKSLQEIWDELSIA